MGGTDPNAQTSGADKHTHPDARAGGGGPGYFRDANPVLKDDLLGGTVRHAKSPASRMWLAQANVGSASAGRGKKNPPPKTKTLKKLLAQQRSPEVDLRVRFEVRADKKSDRKIPAKSAKTRIIPSSGLRQIAGMEWRTLDGKITAVTKKLVVRGTYVIQTSYGRTVKPDANSIYGRGTTSRDKVTGDITLGFHEWCHQQEYIDYLTSTPFPKFTGKIGMSEADFEAAVEQFNKDFEAFGQGIEQLGPAVDEVGDTKSQCEQQGRCS